MTRFSSLLLLVPSLIFVGSPDVVIGEDWPEWLGPGRESVWTEDDIVTEFPEDGLPVEWRTPIGGGYSGPAVVDGRVYITDFVSEAGTSSNSPGQRDTVKGKERVICLDAKTGKPIWTHAYDRAYSISYASGPRCTPTVDGDRVYTLGAEGDLYCLNVETGKPIWHVHYPTAYSVKTPIWGFSGHPLVDGDKLICLVGGPGSVAVAFDKKTGKELWRALTAREPGYCAPSIQEFGGNRILIIWSADTINGLDPETGEVYWSVPLKPDYGMSIMVPRREGNQLFASGIGGVGALLNIGEDGKSAEIAWKGGPKDALYAANSTPFVEDGIMYGCDCRSGALRAVRLRDGERLWETFEPTTGTRRAAHGTAFLVRHANGYFLFSETGHLILARLTPRGYEEISRFHAVDPTQNVFGRKVVWTHPAFADRAAFIRNDKEIIRVDLSR